MKSLWIALFASKVLSAELSVVGTYRHTFTKPVPDDDITAIPAVMCDGVLPASLHWDGTRPGSFQSPLWTILYKVGPAETFSDASTRCGEGVIIETTKDSLAIFGIIAAYIVEEDATASNSLFVHENNLETVCPELTCDVSTMDPSFSPNGEIYNVDANASINCQEPVGELPAVHKTQLPLFASDRIAYTGTQESCGQIVEITDSKESFSIMAEITGSYIIEDGDDPGEGFEIVLSPELCALVCPDQAEQCPEERGLLPPSCGRPLFFEQAPIDPSSTDAPELSSSEEPPASTNSAEWAMFGLATLLAML